MTNASLRRSVVEELTKVGYVPVRPSKHGDIYRNPKGGTILIPQSFLKPALAANFVRRAIRELNQ